MTNGTSGRNTAIILAGLAVVVVGVGIIAFLLFAGGEEPVPTAATAPTSSGDPGTTAANSPSDTGGAAAPAATPITTDAGAGPGTGTQEIPGTSQTHVFLPGVTPLPQPSPPAQSGPLPVLPWQEDGLDDLEAQVAESLAAIQQTDPATAQALADLPWLADEMLLQDAAAVFLVQEMGSIDPALARQVARLPDLSEQQLADDTVTTLLHLQDLAQADVATARQLLETPWVADGVEPADQATLAIVGGIAAEDPALARQVAVAPEIADGITHADLAALTGSENYFLERLERNFPDIAAIVRGYSWVSGGVSRNPENAGVGVLAYPLANQDEGGPSDYTVQWILEGIARVDAALGQQVAGFPWLTDGVTWDEGSAIGYIRNIARRDLSVAKNIAALPWVADNITVDESHAIRRLGILFLSQSSEFYDGPAMGPLIADQPWFQDGISGADKGPGKRSGYGLPE